MNSIRDCCTALAIAVVCAASPAAVAGVEDEGDAVLLVAKPEMPDINFAQTVVLVTFPQDSGPMGVVLNRDAGLTIGQLFGPDRPELKDIPDPLYLGGPMKPDGMLFLFRAPEHPVKALPVVDDLYLSGDGPIFESLVARPADGGNRKFFAGYAGWAVGQLDAEIRRGDWHVVPVDAETVLAPPMDDLWQRMLVRAASRSAGANATPGTKPGRRLAAH